MSRFRFLRAPIHGASMGSAVAQKAFMNWDQIQVSWKQLKEKFVLQWFRVTDYNGESLELIGAEMPWNGQSDGQPKAFRPDDREKRSEFSLHIGC
jgi:hypothetical protein